MALKVVIAGASGKMGRSLIEAVAAEGMVLHAALDAPGSAAIGQVWDNWVLMPVPRLRMWWSLMMWQKRCVAPTV